jgi:3-oxoacyl-[acyl-carrier-protein] synthase-1
MKPLVISRFSIVSCLGIGEATMLAALRSGASGLQPCTFETVNLETYVGQVAGLDEFRIPEALSAFDCRNNRLAEMAIVGDGFELAVAAAVERYGPGRIGLFLGTSTSGILQAELAYRVRDRETGQLPPGFNYAETQNAGSLAAYMGQRLGIEGPAFVISCACASTAKVFASAARMITAGICDAAIVGGADTLCLTTLYGFDALGLNAAGPCRPFDIDRNGISIGEAAGFALIEKPGNDDSDPVLLLGVGESNDAYHMSSPHPEGLGASLAMRQALQSAGLAPGDIDYINLHGTGTRVGDASEDLAIAAVFGDATPCSSTKGQTGHTLGAAGIVEAIVSVLAIRNGFRPGSTNTEVVDPSFRSGFQVAGKSAGIDTVLSNSFGFGGSNCSLVIGRPR